MTKIDPFDLESGVDFSYDGICTLRPPSLAAIRFITYRQYLSYLNIILVDSETFLEQMGMKEKFQQLDEAIQLKYTTFNLMVVNPSTRVLLQEALSFFIAENVKFDESDGRFSLYPDYSNEPTGFIDDTNFEDIKYGITQLNFLKSEEPAPKIKSSKAKEIYEKLRKGKKEFSKTSNSDKNMSLPNLIAAVSARHNSYNFINIWSLTVYQLFDQFYRLYGNVQLDILGLRWAAWGKEEFDFKVWYQDPIIK